MQVKDFGQHEIEALVSRAYSIIRKIDNLRHDFVILLEQEKLLTQLVVVCEDTESVGIHARESSIAIEDYGHSYEVPGYEELTDFTDYRRELSQVLSANTTVKNDAEKTASVIDSLKAEVGSQMYDLKAELNGIRNGLLGYPEYHHVPFSDYLDSGV